MTCINVEYGAVVVRDAYSLPPIGTVFYPPALWGDYLEERGCIRWRTYDEFKGGDHDLAPGFYADRMMRPAEAPVKKRGRPRKVRV